MSFEQKQIYKKMSLIMADIGTIEKSKTNVAQGFKFRGIDQFLNALHPALIKHGVFMCPRAKEVRMEIREVIRSNGKAGIDKLVNLQMEFEFFAEDGSSVVIGPVPSEGVDSGDKATNKALSAALKYALIQTYAIPTEDIEDGDLVSPEIGAAPQSIAKVPSPPIKEEKRVGDESADFPYPFDPFKGKPASTVPSPDLTKLASYLDKQIKSPKAKDFIAKNQIMLEKTMHILEKRRAKHLDDEDMPFEHRN